ncbi:MAG: pyridoxamine 5'-phosphate oxidase family protein [Umezawaea sp.]
MLLLDQNLAATVAAHRTCELSTLAKDGTPVTWPVSTVLNPGGTFTLTTSLGFPQKAFNIRRDGRVALLFSDPTGSGLDDPPQVLVQGTATCPDEIVTTPGDLADYWAVLFERQPSSRAYLTPLVRPLVDWYYLRLVITVTPTAVTTLPRPPAAGKLPASRLLGARSLAGFPTAVLGARDAEGAPTLLRVRPVPGDSGFAVDVPDDAEIEPGRASLLGHQHDENLAKVKFVLVRGELTGGPGEWTLVPSREVQPAASTWSTIRRTRRSARDYLAKRGLARPRVDWAGFTAVADSVR